MCVDGVALEASEANRLEAELRDVATPLLGGFGSMPAAAVSTLHDDPQDPMPGIGDGTLVATLDDSAIDTFVRLLVTAHW